MPSTCFSSDGLGFQLQMCRQRILGVLRDSNQRTAAPLLFWGGEKSDSILQGPNRDIGVLAER